MSSVPRPTGVLALLASLAATSSLVAAAAQGPCDIYASGGTPCVAAHSTTRALFGAYSGSLYQVIRGSDNTTINISPLSAGGVANGPAQDTFCAGTTCLIKTIYDQSGNGNDLTDAPPGGAATGPNPGGFDYLAGAKGAPVTLNGNKAYGVFIPPKTGYRIDTAKGTATGNSAEGLYGVFDGTHYNDACCFDYGNGETTNTDTGNGRMEALYFGTRSVKSTGAGSGPWIMADLENGLFSGQNYGNHPADPAVTSRFVTGMLKGEPNQWAIHEGNAASGDLVTVYSGARPTEGGYNPMSLEGAIVLGVGGDNSDGGQGTFYEGAMTSGYPSDATEAAVQANIVAANYAITSLNSGPALTIGSSISFRATSPCCTTKYITHSGATVELQVVTSSSTAALQQQASWTVRTGLGNSGCYSFESVDTPGSYLRHSSLQLQLDADDSSQLFAEDSTFCTEPGFDGQGVTLRSWSYPANYCRHYGGILYIATDGGPNAFDATALFSDDVSFVMSAGFAS